MYTSLKQGHRSVLGSKNKKDELLTAVIHERVACVRDRTMQTVTVDRTSKFLEVWTTKVNQKLNSVNTEELLLMKLINVNTNERGWRGGSIFKPHECKHQQARMEGWRCI